MTYEQWYEKYVKGKPTVEAKEKAVRNQAADKRQFERYNRILRDLSPKTFDEFVELKYNNNKGWKNLKAQCKILNAYKIDHGNLKAEEILKMDRDLLFEKRNNFTSKYKNSGNIAGIRIDNKEEYLLTHSRITEMDSIKYKGNNKFIGLKEDRHFTYKDVIDKNGDLRTNTFYDMEAKLIEYLEDLYKIAPFEKVDMLSERGMCDSCIGVMKQFIAEHPTVVFNAVSNKEVEGNVWKDRL